MDKTNILLSKTLTNLIDTYNCQEVITIMLNMNNKYNLYDTETNFFYEWDALTKTFYLYDQKHNGYEAGVTSDVDFPEMFSVFFIYMADGKYMAICDADIEN